MKRADRCVQEGAARPGSQANASEVDETGYTHMARSPLESLGSLGTPGSRWPPWLVDAMQDPAKAAILSGGCAVAVTLAGISIYRRFLRRIPNADSVTAAMIEEKRKIVGVVTRVGDGDGFRLYHTPGPFWRFPLKLRSVPTTTKELKNETLSIRIAGVDAPELAHFGNPAQPYAKESLDWLTNMVDGRRVKCQLLRKDQYGRIVAVPWLCRSILPDKPLPLMMLREGVAVVYTQGGAEFGPWGLDKLQAEEDEARKNRRGLWGGRNVEKPGDFKRRVREGSEEAPTTVKLGKKRSLWEALGRWLGGKT
ncbi:hypothetical protein CspHIS471_0701390 [Cutaneotrichosporon sp. HIS471]|nr:hypothetical protein CspHIS471_0701390 [Cutaneotrichosporon sp. HIS471]